VKAAACSRRDLALRLAQLCLPIITVWAALLIYNRQKATAHRNVIAQLSRTYTDFHARVLGNPELMAIGQEMLLSSYTVEQAKRIEYFYLLLNILLLEWHFSRELGHSDELFESSLQATIGRAARNMTDKTLFLARDFDQIFADFPLELRARVKACLDRNLPRGSAQPA
jgi:hypothetical protein